ncbi:MAG TPA: hypothetical protein VMS22_22295 [Candidatus Eisenbacteria bacterium]|nr:hypothetical protein [Candidatus Eisenbacteria bacterium]
MTRGGAALVVALVGLLAGGAPADARMLCRKPSGKVFARDACRKKETQIDPGQLGVGGPQGMAGVPGAIGPAGRLPIRVTDANGREVGPLADIFGGALLAFTPTGETAPVLVEIDPSGVADSARFRGDAFDTQISYESTDCTGEPFLFFDSFRGTFFAPTLVIGSTVSYPVGATRDITVRSIEHPRTAGLCGALTPTERGTCCEGGLPQAIQTRIPARRFAIADIPFTPPFSAALR